MFLNTKKLQKQGMLNLQIKHLNKVFINIKNIIFVEFLR